MFPPILTLELKKHNNYCYTYTISFLDVNECDDGNGGCENSCNNTDGSFICSCNIGYQLYSNRFCSGMCLSIDRSMFYLLYIPN